MQVSFMLVAVLCAGALLPGRLLPLLWAAVLLHEGGHFAYILLRKRKVERMSFSLTGVRVTLAGDVQMGWGEELLLNLCGPAANLLVGGGALVCGRTMQSARMAAMSFAIAAATLLPLGNSDGAAAVDILLQQCCGMLTERWRKWLRRIIAIGYLMALLAVLGYFG